MTILPAEATPLLLALAPAFTQPTGQCVVNRYGDGTRRVADAGTAVEKLPLPLREIIFSALAPVA